MLDVLVIGGGPSGSHFASGAAKKGYKVALIEKGQFGRTKCCAGGLSGRFLKEYRVPSGLIQREIRKFKMISPSGEKTELTFNRTAGVTVNRSEFDAWFLKEAIDYGCQAHLETTVKKLVIRKEKVEAFLGNDEVLTAKVLIGAFGLSPHLHLQLGIQLPKFCLGLQAEIPVPKQVIDQGVGDCIEFFFDPKYSTAGYSWVFPKKDNLALGLVSNPLNKQKTLNLNDFLKDYVAMHSELRGYVPGQFRFSCAMLPSAPLSRIFGDHFMLLGDSAGLIDPTTWEGLFFAFKSADLALEVFEENYCRYSFSAEALRKYQVLLESQFGRELEHACSIQRRVYGNRMGRLWKLIIAELNKDSDLKQLVTDELSKDMSIANMVEKIPLGVKLRLAAKYSRQK